MDFPTISPKPNVTVLKGCPNPSLRGPRQKCINGSWAKCKIILPLPNPHLFVPCLTGAHGLCYLLLDISQSHCPNKQVISRWEKIAGCNQHKIQLGINYLLRENPGFYISLKVLKMCIAICKYFCASQRQMEVYNCNGFEIFSKGMEE